MPDWDQWDAEALETFVPWFHRDHFLQHLFHPHNEHRVILTKLQNLALLLINGQWDARLEAASNATLHAALAAAFWLLASRAASSTAPASLPSSARLTRLISGLLFLLAFALFALPFAWQNVLGGFHSQQYWLLGLSFAALVTLPVAAPFSIRWWLGAVAALLALGSMGSGFLAAAVVLPVIGLRLVRRATTLRAAAPTLAVCALIVAVGALTRLEVPWHAEMKAKSLHDFVFSIVHSLQWPWRERDWAALVLWLPWFVVALDLLRPAARLTPHASRLFALGAWVLVQLAATAYARGAGAEYPASRYMDTLTFGAMTNALCLAHLLASPAPFASRLTPLAPRLLTLAWLATLGFGIHNYLANIARWELADAKTYYVNAESNMRRYLASNDPRHLAKKDIPFPSPEGLAERLAIPSLRATMPVPLRTPLPLKPAAASSAFLANDATAFEVDIVHPPRAGLSPATPPLDYTATLGSFAPRDTATPGAAATGEWRSAPLAPGRFSFLKFEIAGQLGPARAPELRLELRDAATDALLADIRPNRTPGDTWRSAYARTPAAPYVVVATDSARDAWLAFSPPVEMARLSYCAWQVTKHAAVLFFVTLGLTAALAVLAFVRRSAPPPPAAASA